MDIDGRDIPSGGMAGPTHVNEGMLVEVETGAPDEGGKAGTDVLDGRKGDA